MAGATWMRLRRKERQPERLRRGAVRAAIEGEPVEKLLELAADELLGISGASRVGIWLENPEQATCYSGVVLEADGGFVPEEWKRLDVSLPFFASLLESQEPVVVRPAKSTTEQDLGPLMGMELTVWVPLRARRQSLGLVAVAYEEPRHWVDSEVLQVVTEQLALAIAESKSRRLLERQRDEGITWRGLHEALLSGAALPELFRRVTEAAQHIAGVEFLAIAPAGREPPKLEILAGTPDWAVWLEQGGIRNLVRRALEENRMAEAHPGNLGGDWVRPERLARVAVIPLVARGESLGVLLAGLASAARPSLPMEALRYLARIVSSALREEEQKERLTEVESLCGALLASRSESVLAVDAEGRIREAGPLAVKYLNLEDPSPGGMRLEELFESPSRENVAAWRVGFVSAEPGQMPEPIEAVTGSGRCLRLTLLTPVQGPGAGEAHWRLEIEDHTPLREAERKLRTLDAEMLSLLDSLDTGVLLYDHGGRVRMANARFGHLTGLDPRRMAACGTLEEIVEAICSHFRDPRAFTRRWRELRERGDEASWDELELLRPTCKVLERFTRPVFDTEGEPVGRLEVYRDITSHRLLQSKLLQTDKMAALGQLVSGIAHELNNPLTSIMGYAQLLLSRGLGPERGADARHIYREAERAARIVKNLLLFARETKPERTPVQLNEVVERMLALRGYELKVENIMVEVAFDSDLPPTLADAAQLQQVVLNLIVNAEQAIQQGRGEGRIRLSTRRISDQRVALEVSDNGPGIPPEIISRVFDPFFTTKPAGLGTGLGLSIVYGIVHEHGGEISVESQPGRGATFTIELPLLTVPVQEAGEDVAAAEATEPLGAEPGREGGQRVMVVEDEPTVAQLIADVLSEEGHHVDLFLDSREALEKFRRRAYDLVICDLKMPHLDGKTFYRALVDAHSPLRHKIVFVTGDTLAPHTLEFLQTSGLPYLAKPFLVEELKSVVHRALSGGSAGRAPEDRPTANGLGSL